MSQNLILYARAQDAKFDETKHPRKHGQFVKKGTGGASAKREKSVKVSSSTPLSKLLSAPDTYDKYREIMSRCLKVVDKGGLIGGEKEKAMRELKRMDKDGWRKLYLEKMEWAMTPKDKRGEPPPDAPNRHRAHAREENR